MEPTLLRYAPSAGTARGHDSLAAVQRLVSEGAIGADDVIVAVLTSTGLKDPGATAAQLPDVPVIEPDISQVPLP